MAVTAHYFVETTVKIWLRTRLIAFRHVPGSHTGIVLGYHFHDILVEFGIDHKVGQITADNASNNNTMMTWIEDALTERGVSFSRLSNRIRYVCYHRCPGYVYSYILDVFRTSSI
jgi:hypothetical protein